MAQLSRGMSHGLTAEVWAGFRKRIRDVAIYFDLACDGGLPCPKHQRFRLLSWKSLDRFYREGGLRAMASPHVHYDEPGLSPFGLLAPHGMD